MRPAEAVGHSPALVDGFFAARIAAGQAGVPLDDVLPLPAVRTSDDGARVLGHRISLRTHSSLRRRRPGREGLDGTDRMPRGRVAMGKSVLAVGTSASWRYA